jgi:hypothetical protein
MHWPIFNQGTALMAGVSFGIFEVEVRSQAAVETLNLEFSKVTRRTFFRAVKLIACYSELVSSTSTA